MSEARAKAPEKSPDAGAWLDQHGDYLFRYAQFRLRDSSAAEDAVQETFLAALKAYERFQGSGSDFTIDGAAARASRTRSCQTAFMDLRVVSVVFRTTAIDPRLGARKSKRRS